MDADGDQGRRRGAAALTVVGALLLVAANVVAGLREAKVVEAHATLLMVAPLAVGVGLLVIAHRLHPVRGGTTRVLLWTAAGAGLLAALAAKLVPASDRLGPLFLRSLLLGAAAVALLLFRRSALARMKHEARD